MLRYTAFQDVGRALEPVAVEGYIEGGHAQGLGWALTEGFDDKLDGRLRNASLLDYRIPTALDLPPIEVADRDARARRALRRARRRRDADRAAGRRHRQRDPPRHRRPREPHMPMTPERVLRAIKTSPL